VLLPWNVCSRQLATNWRFLPVVAERELIDLRQWVKVNSQDLATVGAFFCQRLAVSTVTAVADTVVDLDRLQEFSLNPVRETPPDILQLPGHPYRSPHRCGMQ
jgi:hypothetical protein